MRRSICLALCPLSMSHRRSFRTIPSASIHAESAKFTSITIVNSSSRTLRPVQWAEGASGQPHRSQRLPAQHDSVCLPLLEEKRKGLPVSTRAPWVRIVRPERTRELFPLTLAKCPHKYQLDRATFSG